MTVDTAPGLVESLAARRTQAAALARLLPMPSNTVDEDWRRTDISKLRFERFDTTPGNGATAASVMAEVRIQRDRVAPGAALMVTSECGAVVEDSDMLTAQGAVVCTLAEAVERHPDQVLRALDLYSPDEGWFAAHWHEHWRDGCFVHVPRSVHAATPIVVAHTATRPGVAVVPATLVILEEGAVATVIELFTSATGDGELFSNAATLMRIGRNARLDYSTMQLWDAGAWHFARHRAALAEDAHLQMFAASFGGRLQKAYWDALLEGRGGSASINGICFADHAQHFDHQSLQAHRAPDCQSDLLLKVAARDHGHSVYSGLIEVSPVAQRTDGYVQNRNLLLSPGARASSIPRLEIRANDVRCSHGTTSGHIDDEERFYLEARGVPREEADRLIVRGFMQDALGRATHEGVRTMVGELLDATIAGTSVAGLPSEAIAMAQRDAAEAGVAEAGVAEASVAEAAVAGPLSALEKAQHDAAGAGAAPSMTRAQDPVEVPRSQSGEAVPALPHGEDEP